MSVAATPDKGLPPGQAGLFTRQASGLVREIGVLAAVGISVGSVAIASIFPGFDAGLTSFGRADMYIPLIIGLVVWIVAMYAYRHLVDAIPRAGGEYVYVSRIISPVAGAVVGIFTAVVLTYGLAANIHIVAAFVPFMLTSLGAAFHSSAITNAANHVTSNLALLLISCGVMLAVGAVSIFSLRRIAQIVLVLILVQLLAFAVLMLMLADHSHSDFVAAFARYTHHPGAYQAMISAGKANGIAYGSGFAAMIGLLPLMILAYNGVLYSYYVGGELRRPGRTYLYASAIGLALLAVVWIGSWALMRHTVGLNFMQAQTNLAGANPTAYGKITDLNAGVTGMGYGIVLSGDPITKILFGLAIPFGATGVGLAFVAVVSRILMALSFDRMLPLGVAKVSERTHAPVVAIGIVVLASLGFCALLVYASLANLFALLSLFVVMILFAGGLAATFLAHRRPDLVTKPGQTDVPRRLGLPTSTWTGGLTVAFALFAAIEVIAHPTVYGKFSAEAIVTLAVVLLAGPVIYLIARTLGRQRNQIDLNLAMRELPPE